MNGRINGLMTLLVLAAACGAPGADGPMGAEGEACYPNGTCNGSLACIADQCTVDPSCVPDCVYRECGPDPACGQSCGTCGDGLSCQGGTCLGGTCEPDCIGRECGLDPLCGQSCGSCNDGMGCTSKGLCLSVLCDGRCADMVSVGGGSFLQGCPDFFDSEWVDLDEARPAHEVQIPSFEIDRYEITVSDYEKCVTAGYCNVALAWIDGDDGCNWGVSDRKDHPINCLSFEAAEDFCAWTGKRMCSESEWEMAARGTDERLFPWGNDLNFCKYVACEAETTSSVGSKPLDASPYGVLDMGGNVLEWVRDAWHDNYDGAPTDGSAWGVGSSDYSRGLLRGGSFNHGAISFLRFKPDDGIRQDDKAGARCCKSRDTGCKPECDQRECGLDAKCGVACGVCGSGRVCEEGHCVPDVRWSPETYTPSCSEGMCMVPAGPFWMGCDSNADPACNDGVWHGHQVTLSAFRIDRTEVTVAAYRACVTAGDCTEPLEGCLFNWGSFEDDDDPVNCVTWDQARAYCAWLGKRLPTEAEFEKAARGTDRRTYPWGPDRPTCDLAAIWRSECSEATSQPVCSKAPAGNSPYDACDLAGNVAEWTADWYEADFYLTGPDHDPKGPVSGMYRVVRGGSHESLIDDLKCASRNRVDPTYTSMDIGFRCARTP